MSALPPSADVKSAVRVLQIFQLFAEIREPASLATVSGRLGLPKSSCLALLKTLESNGYLYQLNDSKDYYPTRRMFEESGAIVGHDPLLVHLRPVLRELAAATRETVFLARRSGHQSHYIEVIESGQTLRFAATAGEKRPLYIGAAGQSLLGGMDRASRNALIDELDFEKFAPDTITSAAKLKRRVTEGNERGWFLSIGGYQAGVSSIGAHVAIGGELFAVVVAAPTERLVEKQTPIASAVVEAARRIRSRA